LKKSGAYRSSRKKLEEAIQKAGKEMSESRNTAKQKAKGKIVTWWTNGLTIMRKQTNALTRRYLRTASNKALRESRNTEYNKGKGE
jgi:vacuolar-type H+-ATPase subunit E/Vma4